MQEYGSNGDDAGCAALPAPTACALPAQTFTYAAETTGAQVAGGVGNWGTFAWAAGMFPGAGGRYRVGDFNGDGKTDVLYIAEGSGALYVNLSGSTSTSGLSYWGAFGDGSWVILARYQIGDFNGDGKADVMWVGNDTRLYVALSTGTQWVNGVANSGFVGRGDWGGHGNGNDLGRYRIADYDGDGKADVGFIGGDGYFGIAYSSGSGFPTFGGTVVGQVAQVRVWGASSRLTTPGRSRGTGLRISTGTGRPTSCSSRRTTSCGFRCRPGERWRRRRRG